MLTVEALNDGSVYLVPYDNSHIVKTVEWLNSDNIREEFGLTYKVTESSHKAWLLSQSDLMVWGIQYNDEYIGNVSIRVNSRHRKGYFEIYIGNTQYQGKGIGKTALRLICEYGFNSIALNRIFLYTHKENLKANQLYRSAGFKEEGVERESILKNGIYLDQILWSLLRSDWEERSKYDL